MSRRLSAMLTAAETRQVREHSVRAQRRTVQRRATEPMAFCAWIFDGHGDPRALRIRAPLGETPAFGTASPEILLVSRWPEPDAIICRVVGSGKSSRRRDPAVVVRANFNAVPASSIELAPASGRSVRELEVSIFGVDSIWRGAWGGPVFERPHLLTRDSPARLFVFPGTFASGTQLSTSSSGDFAVIATDEDFFLSVEWEEEPMSSVRAKMAVISLASDRNRSRPPILLEGERAARFLEQTALPSNDDAPQVIERPFRRAKRVKQSSKKGHRVSTETSIADRGETRLSRLAVEGLRGFRSEASLRLAQPNGQPGSGLSIVVGANNAGKSTLWEALDAVARKLKTDVSFSEGRRNRNSPNGVRVTVERLDGSSFLLASRSSDTSETTGVWAGTQNPTIRPLEIVSVPSRRQFQANFGKNITSQRDWMSSNSDFARSRQFDSSSLFTGRLFDLHNDPTKKARFDALMREVLGHPLAWAIDLADGYQGQSYYLKIATGDGGSHTSEGLGDGIISLMFIINALFDSEPHTVLSIDEPELSLHPQHVRRLGRMISRLAADRQIIVYTHSPVLISWDDIAAGAEIARVYKADGESLIAQPTREAVVEVSRARGGWKNPHGLGLDANSTLFLDDGVIVVEGQEDAALLPVAFENLGLSFNGTIFGWGSGGATNIPRVLQLLRELGFKRVAAVLDNDVTSTFEAVERDFPEYLVVAIPAADIRDKPSTSFSGKLGLMDERGKAVKSELAQAARDILGRVSSHLQVELDRSLNSAGPDHT
ncbi:MAG: hypothetical protein K0R99_4773 [Microbacterium sp.]|nr:hypothetical protein [Microbacterium sp.]